MMRQFYTNQGHIMTDPKGNLPELIACPCCGYVTLGERNVFEICVICWWEDDGQDNADANVVRGGPNSALSLTRARFNFLMRGIANPVREDLRPHQERTEKYIQGRFFVFDEAGNSLAEPAANWQVSLLDDAG